MKYFGGIEGGATHSRLIICNDKGECVATTTGLGTNHWIVGIPECSRRIADMVERAKEEANIPDSVKLISLGLCLSGCEQDASNKELEMDLRHTFPDIAENYVVRSDTVGSLFTASSTGGLVVISGTGSNTMLMNPNGCIYTCGGWGHLIGDEGSAWYISFRAMKLCFDDIDNLQKAPHPIKYVWELIKSHFNVETRFDLLPHCYAKFDKPFFASLCKKLAELAEEGDGLAKYVFEEAGRDIAKNIQALLPKVHKDLLKTGNLNVVCVGSVWHSWPLLYDGFVNEISKRGELEFGLLMVRITKSMAYGACYLAADDVKHSMPRNYSDNFEILFNYNTKHGDHNGISSSKNNISMDTKITLASE